MVFDHHFHIPKHLFADLADRRPQRGNCIRCVPIEDIHKILVLKRSVIRKAAPGQDGVGGADFRSLAERNPYVIFIIFRKKAAVNDAANVVLVFCPMYPNQFVNRLFYLRRQCSGCVCTIDPRKCIRYRLLMFLPQFP